MLHRLPLASLVSFRLSSTEKQSASSHRIEKTAAKKRKGRRLWENFGSLFGAIRIGSKSGEYVELRGSRPASPGPSTMSGKYGSSIAVRGLEVLEDRTVPAVVGWDGGAGTFNWGDAGNWSTNQLPTSADSVVIPDLAGTPTILLNVPVTVKNISSLEAFRIENQTLTLTDGATLFSAALTLFGAQVTVKGSALATSLTTASTVDITSSTLLALQGGSISLPALTAGINLHLRTEDANSVISLPSFDTLAREESLPNDAIVESFGGSIKLPALTSVISYSYGVGATVIVSGAGTIQTPVLSDTKGIEYLGAINGGKISLPSLSSWATSPAYLDSFQIVSQGTGSQIDLPNVTSVVKSNPNGYWLGFHAQDGGVINLPQLTSIARDIFFDKVEVSAKSGGKISMPMLTSANSIAFTLDGSTSAIDLSRLASTAENSSFALSGNSKLSVPFLSTVEDTYFNIDSSSVNLTKINSVNNCAFFVSGNAKIVLSGFTTATNLRVRADGAGASVELPNLTSITRYHASSGDPDLEVFSEPGLEALGGTIKAPALQSVTGTIGVSFGNRISVRGPGAIEVPLLSDISGVTYLEASAGGKLTLPAVISWTTWQGSGSATVISAEDATSKIDLPNLTTLTFGAQYVGELGIYARRSATVNLPQLTSMTVVYSLPLGVLAESGGKINLPLLTSVRTTSLGIKGATSSIDLSQLASANQSSFNINDNAKLMVPLLTSMDNTSVTAHSSSVTFSHIMTAENAGIWAYGGSKVQLNGLTTATNLSLRSLDPGTQIDVPQLTSLTGGTLVAQNGSIKVPLLNSISYFPYSVFSYSDTGSIDVQGSGSLEAPELADFTGIRRIRALHGGQISLPSATSWNLVDSRLDFTQLISEDLGSRVDLPNLSTITFANPSSLAATIVSARFQGVISLPKLTTITNLGSGRFEAGVSDGGILDAPILESITGVNLGLRGTTSFFHAPKLATISQSMVAASEGYQFVSGLVSADDSKFIANANGVLRLPGLQSAKNLSLFSDSAGFVDLPALTAIVSDQPDISMTATGGTIHLPSLAALNRANGVYYGQKITIEGAGFLDAPSLAQIGGVESIEVSVGGKLSLPGVISWSTAHFDSNEMKIVAKDAGSLLRLPNLTSIEYNNTLPLLFRIDSQLGGMIDLPKLATLASTDDGTFGVRVETGATLSLPLLVSANNIPFDFSGPTATANLAKLAHIDLSTFSTSLGFLLSLPSVETSVGTTFNAASGSRMQLGLKSATNLRIHSENASSVVSFPNLSTLLRDASQPGGLSLEAIGGSLDLPLLTAVTRSTDSFDAGEIRLTSTGRVYAPLLADISGIDRFEAADGARISLPGVTSWTTANFNSDETSINSLGAGSLVEFPNLAYIVHAHPQNAPFSVFARNGGTVTFSQLATFLRATAGPIEISAETGGSVNLPQLIEANMLDLSVQGVASSLNAPLLSQSIQSSFSITLGAKLTLPSLTTITDTKLVATWGASALLPAAITATNLTLRSENGAAKISLPNLTMLKVDNLNQDLLSALDGSIDLPKLASIPRLHLSYFASNLVVSGTGSLNVPLLAELDGISLIKVLSGAQLSLPAPIAWSTPSYDTSGTSILASGAGTHIEFPNLISLTHRGPATNSLSVTALLGATIAFPKLLAVSRTGLGPITFSAEVAAQFSLPRLDDLSAINFTFSGPGPDHSITWTGAGGNLKWSTAANWNLNHVPEVTENVVIPDLPGNQSIVIDANVQVLSLANAEGLTIAPAQSLTLTSGASQILGAFSMDRSALTVTTQAQLLIGAASSLANSSIYATSGGNITVFGLATAMNLALRSESVGSSIVMPGLTTLVDSRDYPTRVALEALGGTISLPTLVEITRHHASADVASIWVKGSGQLLVPQLISIAGIASIQLEEGARLSLPGVTGTSIVDSNSFPFGFRASDPGTFLEFPNVSAITYSYSDYDMFGLLATNGATISLPKLTVVSCNSFTSLNFGVETGGRLELPRLASSNKMAFHFASATGSVDLSKLDNLDRTTFVTSDGFSLTLPAVTSSVNTTFSADSGSTIFVPNLTTATNLQIHSSDSGTWVGFPKLVSIPQIRDPESGMEILLEAKGGAIDLPALTSTSRTPDLYSGGSIYCWGTGSINAPLLSDFGGIDYIHVNQGAKLSFPGVTAWSVPDFESAVIQMFCYGSGSALTFPSLVSMTQANPMQGGFYLSAENGGTVSLPRLQTITQLATPPIIFHAGSGGRMELPALTSTIGGAQFNFADFNSFADLSSLSYADQSFMVADTGFVLDLPSVISANGMTLYSLQESIVRVPSLIAAANLTLLASFGNRGPSSIALPKLVSLTQDATLPNTVRVAAFSSTIELPALTTIARTNTTIGGGELSVDGTGRIDAPLLTNIDGIGSVRATEGGRLSLPGIVTWTTPAFDSSNPRLFVRGQNSLLEFANLVTLTHIDNVGYEFAITVTQSGTLSLPQLTTIAKTGNVGTFLIQVDLGGIVQVPELTTANRTHFDIDGSFASMALPKLATANHAAFLVSHAVNLTLPSLIAANGSAFNASDLSTILTPLLRSAANLEIHAEDYASAITMPALIDLSRDRSVSGSLILEATANGTVDLPALVRLQDSIRDTSTSVTVSEGGTIRLGSKGAPLLIKNATLAKDLYSHLLFVGTAPDGPDFGPGPLTLQGSGDFYAPPLLSEGGLKLESDADWSFHQDIRLDGGAYLDIAPGATLGLTGSLTGTTVNSTDFRFGGTLRFEGHGTAQSPQWFEASSADHGNLFPTDGENFYIEHLELAPGAYVKLQDLVKNSAGAGRDAIYVGSVTISDGATLDLNGVELHAKNFVVGGTVLGIAPTQIVSAGSTISTYGATKSFAVLTTGNSLATKFYLIGSVPAGVQIDLVTGVIDIGSQVRAGTYYFQVVAANQVTVAAIQNFSLIVNRAELTLRAMDQAKAYGEVMPSFAVDIAGLVNGENSAVIAGLGVTTVATRFSPVGTYTLKPTGANPNYAITLVDGSLTVTKASLTIQAEDKTKVYGAAMPALTFSVNGLVNGDTLANFASLAVTTSATAMSNAGSYPLVLNGLPANPNYQITLANGTLTIAKAAQNIVWANPSPIVYGTKLSGTQLTATVSGVAGGTPAGGLSYDRPIGTLLSGGTQILTVTAAETANYLATSKSVSLVVNKAVQAIAWDTPLAIGYGTKLSSNQLNASNLGIPGGSAPGSLIYDQAIGDLLNAGSRLLTVTAAETDNYLAATKTVILVVNKAAQNIAWATPAGIVYGTKLSADQLNAVTTGIAGGSAPGMLIYGQAIGDILNAGIRTLTVTAAETVNYLSATKTVQLAIAKAAQTITWSDLPQIDYGVRLTARELGALAKGVVGGSPAGTLSYDRALGELLNAGSYTITATAAETANYLGASKTVNLLVNKTEPTINWATPAAIPYGTKLSTTQLNAEAIAVKGGTAPGQLTYNRALGEFLGVGTYSLSVTSAETENYLSATKSVNLIVDKAHQTIDWSTPGAIVYGTRLSTDQLNAKIGGVLGGSAAGMFSYNLAIGELLNAGKHTLTISVAGTENYLSETQSVTLLVEKAHQAINWTTPDPIVYGTKLSSSQFGATVNGVAGGSQPGALSYDHDVGELLHGGKQSLVVSAAETENYLPESKTVTLVVEKAKQTIAWDQPIAIVYGTRLSTTQLNASGSGLAGGSAPGALSYSSALDSLLNSGPNLLTVTAAETADYLAATQTTTLLVNKANQVITWANPAPISFGTPLSATQLNATVHGVAGGSSPGILRYDRASGESLQPGSYTLAVSAAETDNYLAASKTALLLVTQAPGFISGSAATFLVGSAGSFTVLTNGFPAPTITLKSGVLPAGVALQNGVILGTPGQGTGKAYSFVLAASNGIGGEITQNFTLNVNQPASISSANKAILEVGKAGSFSFAATGFPLPVFSLGSGSLPDGVTLTPGGLLSGTPKPGTGKVYTFTVAASNGVGQAASQSFTLTVNQAPAITSANSATVEVGKAASFSFASSGFPGVTYALKSGSLPAGITLSPAGILSGTALPGTAKSYALMISATNGVGAAATQTFTLNVTQAPTIISANQAIFEVGKSGSFSFVTSGFPAAVFSLKAGNLPDGLALSPVGVLSGTPRPGTGNMQTITVLASNGIGMAASQNFTIVVNEAPAFTSVAKATFEVGKNASFSLSSSGFPGAIYSIKSGLLPSGVSLSPAGVLSGTPRPGTANSYTVTFVANNGVGPLATQTFTMTVTQAPAITSANRASFEVNKSGSFTITASGFPAAVFSLKSGALPDGVTLSAGGLLSGTPKPGSGKNYVFTVLASNGIGSAVTQDVTLTVTQPPAIMSAAKTAFEAGKAGSFTFSASGFPSATFALSSGTLPEGVTLTATGFLSGTPKLGSGKNYPIVVTATNGVGLIAKQNFTLTVNQAPAITSASQTFFEAGKASSFLLAATGFPAATFTIGSGALPEGLTLSAAGLLSGTPAAGSGKVYALTIIASNGVGSVASQTFQLTVGAAASITSANQATFEVGKAATFMAAASGFPLPVFRLVSGSLPAGISLTGAGLLAGTAEVGTGKTYSFTLGASNAFGTEALQNFMLTVNEKPSFGGNSAALFEAGKAGTFTITAYGYPAPTFKLASGALPAGLKLSADGILSGTPAANLAKSFSLNLTATNGVGSVTSPFTLTVGSPAKITSAAKATFQANATGSFQLTSSGFPAATYRIAAGTLPAGIALGAGGLLTGKASVGSGGVYALTLAASNGLGLEAMQNFTLTVNEAPAFTSLNNATFRAGLSNAFSVTATGVPLPSLSIAAGTLPAGVSFDAKTGTLFGTPSLGSPPSTATITFKATNSLGTTTQSLTLIVANRAFSYIQVGTVPILTTTVGAASGVTAWGAAGKKLGTINPYPGFTGKINTLLADLNGDLVPEIITSPGAGLAGTVKVFDGRSLAEVQSFSAYDLNFTGGVSVAVADTDGDGTLDLVTSPGKGTAPLVKVFDQDARILASFNAYDASNKNGLTVLTADTNLDGKAEILTIPNAPSLAELRRFDMQGTLLNKIQAFEPAFTGGVSVALGDLNGDGKAEIVVSSLAGRTSAIRTFAATGELLKEWTPVASLNKGGTVVVGDLDGDRKAEIVFAVGAGAAPTLKVFDQTGQSLAQITAYDSKFTGGVSVALADLDGNGTKEIITAPGKGTAPQVKRYDNNLNLLDSLFAAATGFTGGINLG